VEVKAKSLDCPVQIGSWALILETTHAQVLGVNLEAAQRYPREKEVLFPESVWWGASP